MVTTEHSPSEADYRFVIRPNCSLTGRCALIAFGLIALVTLGFSIRFALLGAWVVLPLTLIELVVLAVAMYLVAKKSRKSELVSVNQDRLLITRPGAPGAQRWSFQPYWVQMILRRDPKQWYPSRLWIRSHGREVEIGACLVDSERERLAKELKLALGACGAQRYA